MQPRRHSWPRVWGQLWTTSQMLPVLKVRRPVVISTARSVSLTTELWRSDAPRGGWGRMQVTTGAPRLRVRALDLSDLVFNSTCTGARFWDQALGGVNTCGPSGLKRPNLEERLRPPG